MASYPKQFKEHIGTTHISFRHAAYAVVVPIFIEGTKMDTISIADHAKVIEKYQSQIKSLEKDNAHAWQVLSNSMDNINTAIKFIESRNLLAEFYAFEKTRK